ncbi:protein slit-like [Dendronephthya gigantea]|uniref:protein slit-like n=1 Tax=Dendronephthya gigantea TaxID=151771 RepID=UPI00106D8344|nr:protein slit-like [Dendronephthya gigantea]
MKVLSCFILLFSCYFFPDSAGGTCPSGVPNGCECDMVIHQVKCKDITVRSDISSWLPNNTNQLELENCDISVLNRDSFKNVDNLTRVEIFNQQRRLSFNDSLVFQGLKRLFKVNLNNNNIASLPAGLFANLPRLDQVFLSNNRLNLLPDDLFENSTNVQNLQLGYTRLDPDVIYKIGEGQFGKNFQILLITGTPIEHLKDGLFSGLPKLKTLGISNCEIKSIGADILKGTEITSITLDGNPIKFINENAFQGSKVTTFQCNGCQLTSAITFNGFLKKMSLSQISFQNNNLTTIPEDAFTYHRQLHVIQLSNNSFQCDCNLAWLQTLPRKVSSDKESWKCAEPESVAGQIFVSLKIEEFCYQSGNYSCPSEAPRSCKCNLVRKSVECKDDEGITEIPSWIPNNTKFLTFENCSISLLHRGSFKNLVNLTGLKIRNNKQRLYFKDGSMFQDLKRLFGVDFSGDNIDSLPAGLFANFPRLQVVSLNYNPLVTLPVDLLENSTNLKHFECENTSLNESAIDNIGKGYFGKNILNLKLTGTPIRHLKDGLFSGLSKLSTLEITNCGIKTIGADIIKGTKISNIKLDGNPIEFINEKAFRNSKISNFQCVGCHLCSNLTFNGFLKKMSLHRISLQRNKLTYVPKDAFMNQRFLHTIDLSENLIETIEDNPYADLPSCDKTTCVVLRDNPLNCDCKLAWLRSFADSIQGNKSSWKCAKPQRFTGKSLVSVNINQFCCESNNTSKKICGLPDPNPNNGWVISGHIVVALLSQLLVVFGVPVFFNA